MGKTKIVEEPIVPLPAEESGLRQDQYEVLVAGLRSLENALTGIDRDLEHDRQDLQDFKVRLGTMEEQVRELRNSVNLNAQRTKDKVADVVEPMQKEVSGAISELKEAVEKKKVLVLKGKGFFARIFNRK